MYIFLKGKKKLKWAIPSWIGLFSGILFVTIYQQKEIADIFITFGVAFLGSLAFTGHVYGIINMYLNGDFSRESYQHNRAIVQILYLLALVPIIYWYSNELRGPVFDSVLSTLYFLFTIYSMFILAGALVMIIAGFISFVVDFLVHNASEFPDKLQNPIAYDTVSICYSAIPVSIVLVFLGYYYAANAFFSQNGYLTLWLLLPLIVLYCVDLNCFLIRSLPREQVSNIRMSRETVKTNDSE
jgi:hypothetical protein